MRTASKQPGSVRGPRKNAKKTRLPHERDESPDSQSGVPDKVIDTARRDIESGKKDTDLYSSHNTGRSSNDR